MSGNYINSNKLNLLNAVKEHERCLNKKRIMKLSSFNKNLIKRVKNSLKRTSSLVSCTTYDILPSIDNKKYSYNIRKIY